MIILIASIINNTDSIFWIFYYWNKRTEKWFIIFNKWNQFTLINFFDIKRKWNPLESMFISIYVKNNIMLSFVITTNSQLCFLTICEFDFFQALKWKLFLFSSRTLIYLANLMIYSKQILTKLVLINITPLFLKFNHLLITLKYMIFFPVIFIQLTETK